MSNLYLFISSSWVQRYGAWYMFENKENIINTVNHFCF